MSEIVEVQVLDLCSPASRGPRLLRIGSSDGELVGDEIRVLPLQGQQLPTPAPRFERRDDQALDPLTPDVLDKDGRAPI
jgi:hypothetical protein